MRKISIVILSLVTILGTLLLGQLFPWWSFLFLCLPLGYFSKLKPLNAFSVGFFCLFAAWFLHAYWLDDQNAGILSARMGQVMVGVNSFGLMVMTGAIGGIGAGIAFALGSSIKKLKK
nr:hypothetical protein [Saprospiraceae bacterium]